MLIWKGNWLLIIYSKNQLDITICLTDWIIGIIRSFASALNLTSKVNDFKVENEPVLEYLPGSSERAELEKAIHELKNVCTEVPIVIDGKEIKTDQVRYQVAPFEHKHKVAKFYWANTVSSSENFPHFLTYMFVWTGTHSECHRKITATTRWLGKSTTFGQDWYALESGWFGQR